MRVPSAARDTGQPFTITAIRAAGVVFEQRRASINGRGPAERGSAIDLDDAIDVKHAAVSDRARGRNDPGKPGDRYRTVDGQIGSGAVHDRECLAGRHGDLAAAVNCQLIDRHTGGDRDRVDVPNVYHTVGRCRRACRRKPAAAAVR